MPRAVVIVKSTGIHAEGETVTTDHSPMGRESLDLAICLNAYSGYSLEVALDEVHERLGWSAVELDAIDGLFWHVAPLCDRRLGAMEVHAAQPHQNQNRSVRQEWPSDPASTAGPVSVATGGPDQEDEGHDQITQT